MLPEAKLDILLARHAALEAELLGQVSAETFVKLSREFAELDPVVDAIKAYRAARRRDRRPRGADRRSRDRRRDARAWRRPSATRWQAQRDELAQQIRVALLPKDAMDERNVILEIRAGTGGDEASLFAGDLFRMYERYAALQGWKVEVISASEGTMGGYKEIIAEIQGRGAVRQAEVRIRRAPRAARARHRDAGPHPHLGGDRRGAAGGRGGRHRDQGRRSARSTPCARRAPAASTSTRPNPRSASPTCRPASS